MFDGGSSTGDESSGDSGRCNVRAYKFVSQIAVLMGGLPLSRRNLEEFTLLESSPDVHCEITNIMYMKIDKTDSK